jgi:hypothetical protein
MTFQELRRRQKINQFVLAVLYLMGGVSIGLLCSSGIVGILLAAVAGWLLLRYGPK